MFTLAVEPVIKEQRLDNCMHLANRILNISHSFLYASSIQNFQYISTVLKCHGSHMSVKIFTLYKSDFWGPIWSKYLYKFFVIVQKWKYPTKVAAKSKQGREKPQKYFVVTRSYLLGICFLEGNEKYFLPVAAEPPIWARRRASLFLALCCPACNLCVGK